MTQHFRVTQNFGLDPKIDEFFHYFPVGTIVEEVDRGGADVSEKWGTVKQYLNVEAVQDIAGDYHDPYMFDQYIPDAYLELVQ